MLSEWYLQTISIGITQEWNNKGESWEQRKNKKEKKCVNTR